jgi:archaeal preflagellin peptidase FlaK
VVSAEQGALGVELAVLLAGFAYAAVADLRAREVSDHLWQVMGILGVALGTVAVASGGALALGLWLLIGAFTLQHVFAWDELLGEDGGGAADVLEIAVYGVVLVVVIGCAVHYGISATGVPWEVIAVLISVLFARGLFEAGVLYGGADAKALMIAAVILPTFSAVLLPLPASFAGLLNTLPFAVDLLMNAALLAIVIPIGLALRNLARHEFRWPDGFTGYMLPVSELTHRFVWLEDPLAHGARERDEVETSDDDQRVRERQAAELSAKGVTRVWVTPQIPFLVLMAAGAVAAVLAGNLVLDLIALA